MVKTPNTDMNFEDAINELEKYSTDKIIKDYELSTINNFTKYLNLNIARYFIVHITGTSGKGSTANFISNMLVGQGVKVGLFTSPHITSVRERISLNGKLVSERDFADLFWFVMERMKNYMKETGARKLTYFEVIFAIALLYFDKNNIEVGVFEVGLGGKLDTTNILKGDVAVITNVGLDHTEILGDTVEKIAKDKVQIVKENAICISGVKQFGVKEILKNRCSENNVKLLSNGKELGINMGDQSIDGSDFEFFDEENKIDGIRISIPGMHQAENAAIAIEVSLVTLSRLNKYSENRFDEIKLRQALLSTKIPGRFEIKQREPLIIWDGAHNQDKMLALVNTINDVTKGDVIMLFAIKKGKDYEKMIHALVKLGPRLKRIVLTKYKLKQDVELESGPASVFEAILLNELGSQVEIKFESNAKKAYSELVQNQKKDEVLLVTGSFYLLSALEMALT